MAGADIALNTRLDTHTQLATDFDSNGFVTVEQMLAADELRTLRRRMTEVAEGLGPSFPSDMIEFEPGASGVRTEATVRKINQCAAYDDAFMSHAANPRILDVVESLIGPDIKLFGSQCFMKPPGGIEKPYHQDSAYFTIEPTDLVTCWTALDDAAIDNGCLWVIPGSHRSDILDHDEPWQLGDRVDMQVRSDQFDRSIEVAIPLTAGSASFHHSRLLHRSGPNRTANSRRGLAIHYMSARSRWTHPTKAKPEYQLLRGREYEDCV